MHKQTGPRALIFTAPQGWGKTTNAAELAAQFNCDQVVDNWSRGQYLTPGALHLTNTHPSELANAPVPVLAAGWESEVAPPEPSKGSMKSLRRLLQWSHEDLNDPEIRADSERLTQERVTAMRRLGPHIEDVVELAWRQLNGQRSDSSESSARSKP